MSLIDCLLMTLFNAAICIALPKAISLIQQQGTKKTAALPDFTPKTSSPSIS